jgi:F-type H+-transporting ATPase subunit epsilon
MPAERLTVAVISPERTVFEGAADLVVAPAWDGEIGILRGHAPLMAVLGTGGMRVTRGGAVEHFHVSGGFLEVRDDQVSVLAEVAERPDEIDAARARLSREHLEKQLNAWSGTEEDFEKLNLESWKNISITEFVDPQDIDPMFFEKPYYLGADEDGEEL